MSFHRLLALFERNRESRECLVLCTVIRTAGSTYAKPGAQMLIAANGEYAGLLSGGCLEGDLREHARGVAATGEARIVSYDLRSSTDHLFGLGAGCEGAMDILLTRVGEREHWQPLAFLTDAARARRTSRLGLVTNSRDPRFPAGWHFTDADAVEPALRAALASAHNAWVNLEQPALQLFVTVLAPPPRLLLAGGGPDARPVATLAAFLGWDVTVVDHRAHYLDATKFPPATQLLEARAEEFLGRVDIDDFAAAVVMSHHLESDLNFLRALATTGIAYVGLLGPAARREKLLADLGADAEKLRSRLRAPVGLDIGGRSAESIALSIIGEVHAVLAQRGGRPFSEVTG